MTTEKEILHNETSSNETSSNDGTAQEKEVSIEKSVSETNSTALTQKLQNLRAQFYQDSGFAPKQRKQILRALRKQIRKRSNDIIEAIDQDFGGRSNFESLSAEIFMILESIKHSLFHLDDWIYDRERSIGWLFWPAKIEMRYQPLGVVGIISPWNYPFQLAMLPIVEAVSAGNYIMLKPSEYTPKINQVMKEILAEAMGDKAIVIEGDSSIGAAFASLPFDHLFFTGSTAVGRLVMKAAAENLTPVTLELGGKSPAIVHESYSMKKAAQRIAFGKFYNAGQTCIAPDYVLCPKGKLDELVSALQQTVQQYYPSLEKNQDYTSIITERREETLNAILADAEEKGATIIKINPKNENLKRAFAPTIVTKVTDDMLIMQEEIFGPILPIIEIENIEKAIQYVNDRPRPLALYYFDSKKKRIEMMLEKTYSGGVTINDTILHVSQQEIGFGGVGASGMGQYHGRAGFETFSNKKGVFYQSKVSLTAKITSPPYPKWTYGLLRFLAKF